MALLKANTGIGTTNPTSALHVFGDGLVTGVVTATTFSGQINSGVGTFTNLIVTNATLTNINSSGISTLGVTTVTRLTAQNIFTSGITTSTGGFVGSLTGIAASATQLVTPRIFEITGDILASPINFDGTGNVSLAATIQPNSVGLGTDTFGDYVKDISGTASQITVTGGTGEGSTPVIAIANNATLPGNVTIANDLQVNNNLNVTGNITIGGTAAYVIVNDFRVKDADIVLGFTTDAYGNDVSNDTTANHGGISVASTVGNPLVQIFNPGIGESTPATYKKIMWFESGAFAGLNTDAWLINYAVGIGSTQFPSGTRLAAGSVQFTERDLAVVRNINASGIVTAVQFIGTASTASFATTAYNLTDAANITAGTINPARLSGTYNIDISGNAATANYATSAGVATYASSAGIATYADTAGIATNVIGGIASVTQLSVSGISTLGIVTATQLYVSGITTSVGGFVGNLTGAASTASFATTSSYLSDANNILSGTINVARLTGTYDININGNATTANYATNAGVSTYADTAGIATYASVAGIVTYASVAGVSTYADTAGIATYASVAGIVTYASVAGVATYASTAGIATSANTLGGVPESQLNVAFASTAGIATNLKGGVAGNVPYQSATDTTAFVTNGLSGQVLLFNGSIPIWGNVSAASGSFGGISIQDEGTPIGTANSITTLNFVSPNLSVTATTGANGIATITMSDNIVGSALSISGISTLGVTSTTNLNAQQLNVSGVSTFAGVTTHTAPLFGTQASFTGVVTASSFSGNASSATYATNAGVATYASTAGIATYATNAGVATYASTAGVATYASVSGISTNVIGGIASVTQLSVSGITTLGVTSSTNLTSQQLNVSGISTIGNFRITPVGSGATVGGIGVTYFGDGSQLTGISAAGGVSISTNTTNQNQFLTYAVSTGSTTGLGVTSNLVFNPSTTRLGIGTTNPIRNLQVIGDASISSNVGVGTTNPTVGVTSANTAVLAAGIVTAYKLYGDGSEITGILKILTIGVRVGAAMTINLTTSSFNVVGRSGNIVINV